MHSINHINSIKTWFQNDQPSSSSRRSKKQLLIKAVKKTISPRATPTTVDRTTTTTDAVPTIARVETETSNQIWTRYVASVMSNHPNKDGVRCFKFRVSRLLEQLEEGELDTVDPLAHLAKVEYWYIWIWYENGFLPIYMNCMYLN